MHRKALLYVALALYFGARVVVLLTGFDEVAIPVYEVPSMGNAAWLASTGWRGVHWSASYDNAGGQVLTAWLAAPLYALFGNRYVVLKLVPLLLGALLLVMIWRVVLRVHGARAANIAALAFALAPPLLFKYSLLAKGNHFEGLFFVFAPIWLLFEGEGRPHRWRFVALAGVAAGVAVSVYIGSLATLAALLPAVLLLGGWRRGLQDCALALPGLVIGLLPAVALHVASRGRTAHFVEHITGLDKAQKSFVAEAQELLTVHLPHATCCEPLGPIPGRALDGLYLAATLAAFALLAWRTVWGARQGDQRETRALDVLTLGAPLIALAALLFTPLRIRTMPPPVEVGGLRYFVPFHFWSLLAIPLALGALLGGRGDGPSQRRLLPRAPARALALALGAALTLAGASSLAIATTTRGAAELALSYPGNHLRLFSTLLGRIAWQDPATKLLTCRPEDARATLDAFAPEERAQIAHSMGSRLFLNALFSAPKLPLEAVLAPIPPEDRGRAARGAGGCIASQLPLRAEAKPTPLLLDALERALAGPYAQDVAFGLGTATDYPLHLTLRADFQRAQRALAIVPVAFRAQVARGLGDECGRRAARGAALERRLIGELARQLAEEDRAPFWKGVGTALAAHGARALELESWVPRDDTDAVRSAF
ncbi:MAG: glycosyltransferase family 39 protein [Planctomycetota bacterium]